jgi:hypothetical protein
MTEAFSDKVQSIVGPVLTGFGFKLDAIDASVDEGGRLGAVVYYRGGDCKMQVYWSAREREINVMIAPLDASNEHGLYNRSSKWHYLNEFAKPADLPLEELVQVLKADRANFESDTKWLEWLKGRISQYFEAAHAGILELYGRRL